jgi:predicted nucleic acid-binding protein
MNRGRSWLILDEKRGRAVAKSLVLPVTGLVAILVNSANHGLIDFEDALARLLATGFRLAPAIIQDARRRA